MLNFPNTLAFKLTFWYTLVIVILITIAFYASYFSLKKTLDRNTEHDLIEGIVEFQILYQKAGLDGVKQEIIHDMQLGDKQKIFFQLFNRKGISIYSSDLSHWQFLPESQHIIKQVYSSNKTIYQSINIQGAEYDAKTVHGLIAPNLLLHTGESTEGEQELMASLSNVFISVFLIVIPIAFFIGWLMANHAVKGIKEVSRIASEIEKGKLDRRVSVSTQDDEISQLVNTFNAMLDRIKSLIFELTEMTDNIAHDLRSPLTRIRVISETALSNENTPKEFKSAASDTIEECDRLLQMINSALDIAEVEADAYQPSKQKMNISQLVQDACELFETMAEKKNIKLTFFLEDNYYIYGNMQNLQRMLANLIDNAIKYTLDGGEINVSLTCLHQNIEIMVMDTGIGIPKNNQSRVFDRFFRCDYSRTQDGCGLGLSYSRAVARSHSGDINLRNNINGGSCFTIVLPSK